MEKRTKKATATTTETGEKVRRGRKPKAVVGYDSTLPCSSDDEHIIMKLQVAMTNEDSQIPCPYNENENLPFSELSFEEDVNTIETVTKSMGNTNLKIVELLLPSR